MLNKQITNDRKGSNHGNAKQKIDQQEGTDRSSHCILSIDCL